MVTRKPVLQSTAADLAPNPSSPPYPRAPISTNDSSFRIREPRNEYRSEAGSETGSENAWRGEPFDGQARTSGNQHTGHIDLPESLRVGVASYTPKSSQDMLRPTAATTNPYLQKRQNMQSGSSASAWGGFSERPTETPPPPPPPKGVYFEIGAISSLLSLLRNQMTDIFCRFTTVP